MAKWLLIMDLIKTFHFFISDIVRKFKINLTEDITEMECL